MLRAIWYLLQIVLLTGVVAWLLQQGGRFDLTLGSYRLQGDTPLFLVIGLILFLILMGVHRVWLWFAHFPRTWSRYRRDMRLTRGHQALVRSLSALASGDHKIAYYQAWRAQKLLPDFAAIPTILLATTAEKQGQPAVAAAALQTLLKTEARDMGVRGLVQAALNNGDWPRALKIARDALAETPRAIMLQRLVYDLECQNGEFQSALDRQKQLVRKKALSMEVARHDRVVMHVALARTLRDARDARGAYRLLKQAVEFDPSFVPAACDLIDLYRSMGKTRRAIRVLERCFALSPHPDLISRYEEMAPSRDGPKNVAKRMKYFERLLALAPQSAAAQLMLARAAMDAQLWGEAHAYLLMAEKLSPSVGVYRALAAYANRQGDSAQAQDYLTAATQAEPDSSWHCQVTGEVYDQWSALILPGHRFGTIIFGVPVYRGISRPDGNSALLSAAAV